MDMTAFIDAWKTKQEITVEELAALPENEVELVDIRDEVAFERGSLPGAHNLNPLELQQGGYDLPEDKLIVCICMWGKSAWASRRISGSRDIPPFRCRAAMRSGCSGSWSARRLRRPRMKSASSALRLAAQEVQA